MHRLILILFAIVLQVGQAAAAERPAASKPPQAAVAAKPAPLPDSIFPTDAELQRILDDRVITYRDTVGLVVGLIEPAGQKILARGTYDIGTKDPVDGDTIFQIGSVTKPFTALLLADMVRRGEVALADPVAKYLPPGTKLPQGGSRPITLLDLATHTSGLPKAPSNVVIKDLNNPNADFSVDQMYAFLAGYTLPREVGAQYEYSNLGYALLGLALTNRAQLDYESLLRSRIGAPLHMDSTGTVLPPNAKDRLTIGHDEHLRPVESARVPLLPGADAIRSTGNDLLKFLAATLDYTISPLAPAMGDMVKVRRPTQFPELAIALGWHVATLHGLEIVWHNGQAPGYRSFVGFLPAARAGVVVLSNSINNIDDIGIHLLDKETPLRALHREISINPTMFDNYVGVYALDQSRTVVVSHDKDRFFIQRFGQPRAELFPEGDDKFFLRDVDAEVSFQTNETGQAHTIILMQDGKVVSARRVN